MFSSVDLIGRWVSPALEPLVKNPDGSFTYVQRDFIYTEKAWAVRIQGYTDPGGSVNLFTGRIEGTYKLTQPSAEVPGTMEAEFFFANRYITAHVSPIVELFNSSGCGDGKWQLNVEQDVNAMGCLFLPAIWQCPIEYDLVKLDGDNIFLGDRTQPLCNPGSRPKKLLDFPITRR